MVNIVGKSVLILLIIWTILLILAWFSVLNQLIGGGWFYGT